MIEVADAKDALQRIKDSSIDLILTDPPYIKGKIWLYGLLAEEAKRILKPGAFMFCYIGTQFLPEIVNFVSPYLNYYWLYSIKHNGSMPRMWDKQVFVGCKHVLAYSKGTPKRKAWLCDLQEKGDKDKRFHKWGQRVEFPRKIVESLTEENEIVLDPFVGGGTTAIVCKELKREFIGFDINPQCVDVSNDRLNQSQLFEFAPILALNGGRTMENSQNLR